MRTRGRKRIALATALLALLWAGGSQAQAPAQRLPSAVLVFPLIQVDGGGATVDTRVELVNLSSQPTQLHCIYASGGGCFGFDFTVQLTPNQPISWLASRGLFTSAVTAIPPFSSTGELKCIVTPPPGEESIDAYNTVQGRAVAFGADGQTIGYGAVGFQRLSDGSLGNVVELDGTTYAQCPDEQHFAILASDPSDPAAQSEIVLTPCNEDFENLTPTTTIVQFQVVNEFEQHLSASTSVTCYSRRTLQQISSVFTRATLGSDTGHLIVRGVQSPVLAMVVDRFLAAPAVPATAGNEPALRGGRPAEITFP
jgi:hypothetical protein